MCQLLGMNANVPTDVMFSFAGLATRADEHKDGFGIAFFEDKGLRLFVDPASAVNSPVADMVRRYPIAAIGQACSGQGRASIRLHAAKGNLGHVAIGYRFPMAIVHLWTKSAHCVWGAEPAGVRRYPRGPGSLGGFRGYARPFGGF